MDVYACPLRNLKRMASNMTSRPSDQWIEYLTSIDTPTLANAIELLNLRPNHEGFTPLEIRCLFPQFGRMCGYAVTAHVESVTSSEPCDLNLFVDLYREVEKSPKPAVIAFQETGGHSSRAAHCGEVMATVFTRLGAIGLVTDCAVRDIPEVRALGFRYFARGAVASHANFRIVRVGVPIQVMGLVIKPGDVLHGDENGLLSIPAEARDHVAAAVESVRSRERDLMSFVRGADFDLDGLRSRIVE
jgi:4-hydroxy-4-methyl-2-oxoglutarate aldolase